jgi:hypothetical protein
MNEAIFQLMRDVPDYQTFLTVDELDESMHRLAKQFPQIVTLLPLGKSRQGSPITAMKIGNGSKVGLMFAMPHPNEPIGSMMLEFLTTRLAEDDELRTLLDFTWYIIKCIDIDGTRLNEGWFKGPFSLTHYARNFYRPPGRLQVEWSFPLDYKTLHFHQPLPETQALMKLIDDIQPDFIYSLHNSGFGGVYAYLTHDIPGFYPDFYRLVEEQKLPLHLGEAEVPYAKTFSKAIFEALHITAAYDFLEKNGVPDPATVMNSGAGSYDYASRFKQPYGIVCEMPYFYNSAITDTSPSDMIRRDAVMRSVEMTREHLAFFKKHYDQIKNSLTVPSPFRDSIEDQIKFHEGDLVAQENWAKNEPSLSAQATVAEKFDSLIAHRFYSLLSIGMFVRLIRTEMQTGVSSPALMDALQAVEAKFDSESALLEKELKYEVVPIQKLVRVQLGAGLLYAGYVK